MITTSCSSGLDGIDLCYWGLKASPAAFDGDGSEVIITDSDFGSILLLLLLKSLRLELIEVNYRRGPKSRARSC